MTSQLAVKHYYCRRESMSPCPIIQDTERLHIRFDIQMRARRLKSGMRDGGPRHVCLVARSLVCVTPQLVPLCRAISARGLKLVGVFGYT